ncbi:hypothetical protein HK102_002220 [Quaeritorhiza haematococci]|nr:hypothetical protein HK102_002220 [Quaeritorhiza haematococci]
MLAEWSLPKSIPILFDAIVFVGLVLIAVAALKDSAWLSRIYAWIQRVIRNEVVLVCFYCNQETITNRAFLTTDTRTWYCEQCCNTNALSVSADGGSYDKIVVPAEPVPAPPFTHEGIVFGVQAKTDDGVHKVPAGMPRLPNKGRHIPATSVISREDAGPECTVGGIISTTSKTGPETTACRRNKTTKTIAVIFDRVVCCNADFGGKRDRICGISCLWYGRYARN